MEPLVSNGALHKTHTLEKLKTRVYFTVSLSQKLIPNGLAFHCPFCGYRLTIVYNIPIAMVEAQVTPEDAHPQKLSENFCKKDNVVFIFI